MMPNDLRLNAKNSSLRSAALRLVRQLRMIILHPSFDLEERGELGNQNQRLFERRAALLAQRSDERSSRVNVLLQLALVAGRNHRHRRRHRTQKGHREVCRPMVRHLEDFGREIQVTMLVLLCEEDF